jgi:hypothetical protein
MKRAYVPFIALLALLLASCGVPADSKPRPIPDNQVPFDLLAPSTTSPPATTAPVATAPVTIFLLGPERLVGVQRTVAAPPSLGTVLASLVQGPTDAEAMQGLRGAINPQTSVLAAQINGDIAVVNVSGAFSGLGVQDQISALAQIVYTATAISGVDGVQIAVNSATVDVPRGDGSTTRDPLRRSDFASLAPATNG